MVKELLVEDRIEAGKLLTESLDKANLQIVASFWIFDSEANEWRLMLATRLVDEEGPTKTLRKIQTLLHKNQALGRVLDLRDIYLAGPEDQIVKDLRKGLRTGKKFKGLRLTGGVVGGHFVEDAYVYRAT